MVVEESFPGGVAETIFRPPPPNLHVGSPGSSSTRKGIVLTSIDIDCSDVMEAYGTPVDTPSSRQKNCNSCVQAKRRCDRRTPLCSRCVEKKIPCIYAKTRTIRQSVQQDAETSGYMEGPSFGSPACGSFFAPDLTLDVDYLGTMPMDSQPDVAAFVAGDTFDNLVMDVDGSGDFHMDPFTSLTGNDSTSLRDQWLAPFEQESMTERPSSPADKEIVTAYQKMNGFCVSLNSTTLYMGLPAIAPLINLCF